MQTLFIAIIIQALAGTSVGLSQPETKPENKPAPVKQVPASPAPAQPTKQAPANPGAQPAITPPGQTPPPPGQVATKPVTKVEKFQTADELLTALETADLSLRTLTADLLYDRTFALQGDRQLRKGKLFFVSKPSVEQVVPARRERKFAIRFDELFVGTRQEKETKFYIFDGIYLVEKLPEQKVFVKRQIAQQGQPFDPLKIGEGPLPIPIGQKKNEILARFNAELLAPESGLDGDPESRKFVARSQQLRLTPRPELEKDSEFREIRLWYRYDEDGALLPRMAKTLNQAEDESLVKLVNVKVNGVGDIPTGLFDTTTPPDGWDVKIQPWREGPENVEYVNGPQVVPDESEGGKAGAKPGETPKKQAAPSGTLPPATNPAGKPAEQSKDSVKPAESVKPGEAPKPGVTPKSEPKADPGKGGTPK